MRPRVNLPTPALIAAIGFLAAACTDELPTSVTDASAPNFGHKPNHNPGGDGGGPPEGDQRITVTFEDRAGDNIRSDGRVIDDNGRVIYVHEVCGVFATFNIRDARMVTDNQKIRPKDATVCGGRDARFVEVEFSSDDLVVGSPRRLELENTVVEGHFFKVNEIELMIAGTDKLVSAVVHLPACGHGLRFSSNRTDQDGLGIAVNDVLVTRNTDGTWTARAEPPNDVAVCIPDEHDKDPLPRTYWHMPFEVTVAFKP